MELKTQVVIICGAITGVGINRDLTIRGVDFVLIERGGSGGSHRIVSTGKDGRRPTTGDCFRASKEIAPRFSRAQSSHGDFAPN